MKQGYAAYQNANVDTNDQGKLILIAYDVAIKHCRLAINLFDDVKKIEERTKHLIKVQDALTELMSSLRMDVGGDIARNLYRLYEYMMWKTTSANLKKDKTHLEEVMKYLVDLRETWREVIQKVKSENPADDIKPGAITMNG